MKKAAKQPKYVVFPESIKDCIDNIFYQLDSLKGFLEDKNIEKALIKAKSLEIDFEELIEKIKVYEQNNA